MASQDALRAMLETPPNGGRWLRFSSAMKPTGAAKARAEAGGRMAAAHHERMATFTLPSGACKPSEEEAHCTKCMEQALRPFLDGFR